MAKQLVKVYNPLKDAYFDADIETAKKFVKSAEEVQKRIEKIEGEK